jgi:hypothetical protein
VGRALAAAAAAVAPARRGHATGSIAAASGLGTDGYLVPPPCMDACLHLGVAAPGCGAKVPVAVGAFVLADRRAAGAVGELSGITSAAHEAPKGPTDTASFALRTPAGGALAGLADLHTKVSQARGAAGQAAAAASVQPADFLYEVRWQAAQQAAAPQAGAAVVRPALQAAQLAFGGSAVQVELTAGAQAAAAAALHLLQAAQAAAVAAILPDVLPQGSASAAGGDSGTLLAAGGLEGLLRVAATEQAAASYTLTAADSLAAGPEAVASQAAERGILGATRVRRGVVAVPRLLPR